MQQKSMIEHNFGHVGLPETVQRSKFSKPYRYKATFDADQLIPIFRQDLYPGDEMKVSTSMYARLLSPIFPIMDDILLETWYFFVPKRLLWENFKYFFGEQKNPISAPTKPSDYQVPIVEPTASEFAEGSFFDYLGVGLKETKLNAYYSRAYNFIFNEFFRDQDLQDWHTVDVDDGPDAEVDYPILNVNKRHDYFTSCRPWPQKFDEIQLPLGDTAPVIGNGQTIGFCDEYPSDPYTYGLKQFESGGITKYVPSDLKGLTLPQSDSTEEYGHYDYLMGLSQDPQYSGVIADLSSATAATINDLREAIAMQHYQELMARSGSRYTEQVWALFNVRSPDARQQRPEYIGGGKQYVNVHENRLNTQANVDANGKLDTQNLSGYMDVIERNGFRYAATEHGVILGLVAIRGAQTYQEGTPRWMTYETLEDYYNPMFANLGEQPVYMREIYADGTSNDDTVFGYQERYAERRTNQSVLAGKMRSTATGTLHAWHLAQYFDSSAPALNSDFIESNLNEILDRVVATPSEPDVMMDALFDISYTTQMPVRSIPGIKTI